MIRILATNITSPIGLTTEHNFDSVRSGKSALKILKGEFGVPGQNCCAVFDEEQKKELLLDGFTWFESLAIYSVKEALSHTELDTNSGRVGFILSTTKANVDQLGPDSTKDGNYSAPDEAAKKIAQACGITAEPITICNACISGVTAQIIAQRQIAAGRYDAVVVCGADVVNSFCLAGFTAFKALSPTPCRPFDIDRLGLNLGEGAATMVLGKEDSNEGWGIVSSHLNNDSYHVSAPSPTGEGLLRAINNTLDGFDRSELATVCLHGTATMFNDQSESLAIAAAGLSEVPVCAYKPYYGHTLGAAGVIEPILTMKALDEGIILPVKGFEEIGVSGKVNVSNQARNTDKRAFLKIISGFGGCNGAILYSKGGKETETFEKTASPNTLKEVRITPDSVTINGEKQQYENQGAALLTEIYKKSVADNPRFYKMDIFSRLVYTATGLLVKDTLEGHNPEDVAFLLFNSSASILADRQHLGTFWGAEDFYPSPSVFINTLPNVVMGEIAVQYGIKGETTFIILREKDESIMEEITNSTIQTSPASIFIAGWVNADSENEYEAELKLIKK